jgi:hypothetical protein
MTNGPQLCLGFSKQDQNPLARRVNTHDASASPPSTPGAVVAGLRTARLRVGGHRAAALSACAELTLMPQGVRK